MLNMKNWLLKFKSQYVDMFLSNLYEPDNWGLLFVLLYLSFYFYNLGYSLFLILIWLIISTMVYKYKFFKFLVLKYKKQILIFLFTLICLTIILNFFGIIDIKIKIIALSCYATFGVIATQLSHLSANATPTVFSKYPPLRN